MSYISKCVAPKVRLEIFGIGGILKHFLCSLSGKGFFSRYDEIGHFQFAYRLSGVELVPCQLTPNWCRTCLNGSSSVGVAIVGLSLTALYQIESLHFTPFS